MSEPGPELLALTVAVDDDRALIDVAGEIDLSTAHRLRDALELLIQTGTIHLVLDMTDVTFMDSTGIEVLDRIINTHPRVNVSLIEPNRIVQRLIRATGLDARLPVA